jgi:hypothetical protein
MVAGPIFFAGRGAPARASRTEQRPPENGLRDFGLAAASPHQDVFRVEVRNLGVVFNEYRLETN